MSARETPGQTLHFAVTSTDAGERLDRWLTKTLPDRSRNEIQRWIRDGNVLITHVATTKPGHKLGSGEQIEVRVPAIEGPSDLRAEPIPLSIVYEDSDLIVVDKPAGLVVHPAPGHPSGTLVNALMYHCPDIEGVGGERRPGIVHRLDRDTSGLIVVAKNQRALRDLQAQFKQRTVYKEYVALVEGKLTPSQAQISAPIGRHPTERKRQAVLLNDSSSGTAHARSAVTDYTVEAIFTASTQDPNAVGNFSLVRAVIHTGRTHQIRVHFAWIKHPIVGDTIYGYRRQRLPIKRLFLHATRLRLQLPRDGLEMDFRAPLPAELRRLLDTLMSGSRGSSTDEI